MDNHSKSLVKKIFTDSNVTWEELALIHKSSKNAKEIKLKDNVKLGVKNLLLFIRAYSRILIDYHVGKRKKFKNMGNFYKVVAGSTNITSDYDVTIMGKGAASVCEDIVNKGFRNIYKENLADVADSNVYISPAFVINKNKNYYPKWFKYIVSQGDVAFPLPLSKVAIKKEIESVLALKDIHHNNEKISIKNRYFKMIKLGKKIENKFLYNSGKVTGGEEEYWDLVHSINATAIEAYVAVSTILTVVLGMQLKKELNLKPIHYLISAYENMINFNMHSQINISSYNKSKDKEGKFLKYSKYIQRIATCYKKAGINIKLNDINFVVSKRGNSFVELKKSKNFNDKFDKFVNISKKIMNTFKALELYLNDYKNALSNGNQSSFNLKSIKKILSNKKTKKLRKRKTKKKTRKRR